MDIGWHVGHDGVNRYWDGSQWLNAEGYQIAPPPSVPSSGLPTRPGGLPTRPQRPGQEESPRQAVSQQPDEGSQSSVDDIEPASGSRLKTNVSRRSGFNENRSQILGVNVGAAKQAMDVAQQMRGRPGGVMGGFGGAVSDQIAGSVAAAEADPNTKRVNPVVGVIILLALLIGGGFFAFVALNPNSGWSSYRETNVNFETNVRFAIQRDTGVTTVSNLECTDNEGGSLSSKVGISRGTEFLCSFADETGATVNVSAVVDEFGHGVGGEVKSRKDWDVNVTVIE